LIFFFSQCHQVKSRNVAFRKEEHPLDYWATVVATTTTTKEKEKSLSTFFFFFFPCGKNVQLER
jgi:hypothetical protein